MFVYVILRWRHSVAWVMFLLVVVCRRQRQLSTELFPNQTSCLTCDINKSSSTLRKVCR